MRCLKCFSEIGDLSVCSVCGFDKKEYLAQPHYMSEGSTLQNGRYKVGCSVGAGGFGITYAAWDDTLNIKVAIKEYLPGEFSTRIPGNTKVTVYGGEKETQFNDGLKKFLEEGKRLAQFRTVQGIVHIYDVFEENGTAYLVMEYLEGETLSEKIKRGEKLDEETVVNLLVEILDALEVVHEKGIIHRDIAPNNIFLCADGSAKLIDFGAARSATGTHSKSLTVLYKKGFTPLEQYQSRGEQGPWTDIYSLAATAYVALTGVVPVGAMERCAKDTLKSPRKAGAKIRSNVEKAIMNSLNLKWKKRTQSASDFRKELLSSKSVKYRFHRENEKKIGKIPMPFLVGSLVVLFSVGIFIGLIFTGVIDYESITPSEMFVESGKSRVINFVNMDEEKAMEKAEKLGFQMEVSYKYDEERKGGVIIEQSEKKGTILDEGSTIHVVINQISNPYNENDNVVWDCVYFGNYYQSGESTKEKIKWRVLNVTGDDAFLLADVNLDCMEYNTSYTGVTWETCTLRSWLNGYGSSLNSYGADYSSDNFIDAAFSSSEKSAIKTITVVNYDNSYSGIEGGNNTQDKIYLLSIEDVTNGAYGFRMDYQEFAADDARETKNTDYANLQEGYTSSGSWWLRSPGDNSDYASSVGQDGHISRHGLNVNSTYVSVRPALHLDLSSSSVWTYAGTVSSKGTVSGEPD